MRISSDYGNVIISFSGGRTSGYLLWLALQANDGKLPDNCKVIFQNTGKEQDATLDFVKACSDNWGVDIIWLEYNGRGKFKEVTYETASRDGEPFRQLVVDNNYLPNPTQRICTKDLKNKTMSYYIRDVLGWTEIENWLGIRADEPNRFKIEGVATEKDKDGIEKLYKRTGEPVPVNKIVREEKCIPLRYEGVRKEQVLKFWKENDFDLQLGANESNCDLCFLKGLDNLISMIKMKPERADFWIEMEEYCGKDGKPAKFHKDRPSFAEMKRIAVTQQDFWIGDTDNLPCECTD